MAIGSAAQNLGEVRESNLAEVIKILQKRGICSRAEIAKESGLRQSTITNIVSELISYNLVQETGSIEGKKGRRSIGVTLNSEQFKVMSIRITRKLFMIGIYDISGAEHCIEIHDFMNSDIRQNLEYITKIAEKLITEYSNSILGIGLAVPGPFLIDEQRILMMTGTAGWENTDLRAFFADRFSLPVFIEQDANAGAIAELWFGPSRHENGTRIYVAAGQGIGAGVMIDGKILHGARGVAGEIGHMSINMNGPKCQCGNKGCLENYCSVMAINRSVKKKISEGCTSVLREQFSMHDFSRAIDTGDPVAEEVFKEISTCFSFGMIQLINLYNPDEIVIGDEFTEFGAKLIEAVNEALRQITLPELYANMDIRFTNFTHDSALIGAAAVVFDKLLEKPSRFLIEKQ